MEEVGMKDGREDRNDEILTVSEAARSVGVAASTIILWERNGKLPAQRTETGLRIFLRADVERLVAQRKAFTARKQLGSEE
jgi:excisionase family DNA binding protein